MAEEGGGLAGERHHHVLYHKHPHSPEGGVGDKEQENVEEERREVKEVEKERGHLKVTCGGRGGPWRSRAARSG